VNRSKSGPSQSLVAGREIRCDLNVFGGHLTERGRGARASQLRDEVAYPRDENNRKGEIIMTCGNSQPGHHRSRQKPLRRSRGRPERAAPAPLRRGSGGRRAGVLVATHPRRVAPVTTPVRKRRSLGAPVVRVDNNGRMLGALGVLLSRRAYPPASAFDSRRTNLRHRTFRGSIRRSYDAPYTGARAGEIDTCPRT
jgi:hypothetical protein